MPKKSSASLYLFVVAVLVVIASLVYLLYPSRESVSTTQVQAEVQQGGGNETASARAAQPKRDETLPKQAIAPAPAASHRQAIPAMDNALFERSLKEGFLPTQELGEMGSLMGVLDTKYPMQYAETQYERIPNSPLLKFNDQMIWKEGEDFVVKRDAVSDQAKHIQEASIALSVSPRIEMGQVTGYRLVEIPEQTLFAKLGMVSGDIIIDINGMAPDMEPMALMFVNMVAGKQGKAKLTYEHRGKRQTVLIRASE